MTRDKNAGEGMKRFAGEREVEGEEHRNEKGRDIGCALAANSCEGASSVEARTITAL